MEPKLRLRHYAAILVFEDLVITAGLALMLRLPLAPMMALATGIAFAHLLILVCIAKSGTGDRSW